MTEKIKDFFQGPIWTWTVRPLILAIIASVIARSLGASREYGIVVFSYILLSYRFDETEASLKAYLDDITGGSDPGDPDDDDGEGDDDESPMQVEPTSKPGREIVSVRINEIKEIN
jgi:hypothetical protein